MALLPVDLFYRSARYFPGRTAIEDRARSLSYQELARRVDALAAAIQALAPEPGLRIGICAQNSIEYVIALLATLAAERVWVPLNPRNAPAELRRTASITDLRVLFADAEQLDAFGDACADAAVLTLVHGRAGVPSIEEAIRARDGMRPVRGRAGRDDIQAIKFTGGSTGTPKGVMQPCRAWMATVYNQLAAYGFDETERFLLAAPISHGTSTYILPVLARGGCLVLPASPAIKDLLLALKERAVTATFMTPTMIYMLMSESGREQERFPALRNLIYAGAPMPPEKIKAVRRFAGPVLATSFGQTEAPTIVTFLSTKEFDDERNMGSVGRAALTADVAVMDPEGRLLAAGQVGEIVVRGDLVMAGYWKMPEETAKTIVDGWLHTGDGGLIDERGYLYLKDRLRSVIITGGFNVYPADVEDVLARHPAVHECAVFGVEDEKWGEAVHAAVQLKANAQASESELILFAKSELGSVKSPKRIHFYDSLPRSPVGKVQKDVLKKHASSPALEGNRSR